MATKDVKTEDETITGAPLTPSADNDEATTSAADNAPKAALSDTAVGIPIQAIYVDGIDKSDDTSELAATVGFLPIPPELIAGYDWQAALLMGAIHPRIEKAIEICVEEMLTLQLIPSRPSWACGICHISGVKVPPIIHKTTNVNYMGDRVALNIVAVALCEKNKCYVAMDEQIEKAREEKMKDMCAACGITRKNIALQACSACGKRFYCSKVCQRKHWHIHRAMCSHTPKAKPRKQ